MFEHLRMNSRFEFPIPRWKLELEGKMCRVRSFNTPSVPVHVHRDKDEEYNEWLHSTMLLRNGDYVYVAKVEQRKEIEDHGWRTPWVLVTCIIPSGRCVTFMFQQQELFSTILPVKP